MDKNILLKKMENIFLELGFKKENVGEKQCQYLVYNECYCKITYLEKLEAFVIESAGNIEDASKEVLEDGDLYYVDVSEENLLNQLKKDLVDYYMG